MRYLFLIVLFSTAAFAQNYHYALNTSSAQLRPPQTILPPDRNTKNLMLVETFENPNLDKNPGLSDFYLEAVNDNSFQLAKNIKRAGKAAGRFEIDKNEPQIWTGNRAEMSQNQKSTRKEGWYGFSQYFPKSYESDRTAEVLVQWHDIPDKGEHVDRSPSNAILASNDRFSWVVRWDADKIMNNSKADGLVDIDLGPIPKGKWIDWVVHIKFAYDNSGILEVWKDGKKVIDRKNKPNAYNDEHYPYFKFGIYRWEWGTGTSHRVIFYDEVRVGNENSSYDEVKPDRH